jgi:GNAT superfamily N-acetyltransferase
MHTLDNIIWHALAGAHAQFAIGSGAVRRYAPGFCPLAAFEDPGAPDFAALAALCAPGEKILCESWHGSLPPGWQIDEDLHVYRMLWNGPIPANDQARDAIKLTPEHARAAFELAAINGPGLFGMQSLALGEYFGYVEEGHLVAMAGERLAVSGLREISGICTHPDVAGRGLARRLIAKLVRRQLMRGETPFMHAFGQDGAAHTLYKRMGFRDHCLAPLRIMSRRD